MPDTAWETRPTEGGAVVLENLLEGGVVALEGAQGRLAGKGETNAVDPHRSRIYETANQDVSSTPWHVTFDAGAVIQPTFAALVDANFATIDNQTNTFFLQGSDDAAGSVNMSQWTLPIRAAVESNGVLAWYLGAPSFALLGAGKRFWGWSVSNFALYPATTTGRWSIGVFFLGVWLPVLATEGARVRGRHAAARDRTPGGRSVADSGIGPRPVEHTVSFDVEGLTAAAQASLARDVRRHVRRHVIVDLLASFPAGTDAAGPVVDLDRARGHGAFYGRLEGGADQRLVAPEYLNSIRLEATETRG